MNLSIVRFPGSNCDDDTRYVLAQLGATVRMVWHLEEDLAGAEAVVIPGGFSYGDYLRSGAVAAKSPIMDAVKAFAERGGPVLGICNGFQILSEAGLLPGALTRNPALHFVCKRIHMRVERTDTPFTTKYEESEVLNVPVAHNEGRYYADMDTLAGLEQNHQVVFRYCTPEGQVDEAASPNGSLNNIAGIVNKRGNVLGMMPHPERAADALLGSKDGLPLFRSLLELTHTS